MKKLFIVFSLLIFGFVCFAEMRYTTFTDEYDNKHSLSWVVNNNWLDEYGFVSKYWKITDIASYNTKPYVRNENREYELLNQRIYKIYELKDTPIIQEILAETGYVYDFMEWSDEEGEYYLILEFFKIGSSEVYTRGWIFAD